MPRWFILLIALVVGVSLGLLYGWVIDPVEYVDTTPETLRADFRTDYVLMVAEIYQAEQNPELAARRLAFLGSRPPAETVAQALENAQQMGYHPTDLSLLQNLTLALQTWQPASPGTQP